MLVIKSHKLTLTLVTYIVLALTLVEASSHSSGAVSRREHGNLKRFVKKRSPFPQTAKSSKEDENLAADDTVLDLPAVIGAGASPPPSDSLSASVSVSTSSSVSASVSQSESVSTSASVSTSVSSSVSVSTSTSASQTTSSSSSTSETLNLTFPTDSSTTSKSTVTLVSTAGVPQQTGEVNAVSGNASKSKTAVLTALIVVASCVGGIAILWTVFRKWKLGRSKQFDQRLQPIDWQPTTHDDDGIIPAHRRHSGASSFRSGARNYGADGSSDYNHGSLQPIPDHDFTAGAPVGGYADLSRGPSPQPQMMERGPNVARSGYDVGVPLHHQAGYGSQERY